jgi:hypothetical protein
VTKTFEEKINTALGSASLAELIKETEAVIEEAASVAETDHARALDIGCSDPAQAEASTRAAERSARSSCASPAPAAGQAFCSVDW